MKYNTPDTSIPVPDDLSLNILNYLWQSLIYLHHITFLGTDLAVAQAADIYFQQHKNTLLYFNDVIHADDLTT